MYLNDSTKPDDSGEIEYATDEEIRALIRKEAANNDVCFYQFSEWVDYVTTVVKTSLFVDFYQQHVIHSEAFETFELAQAGLEIS